jgi:nucleotide-binding universal stress UspA family protein
MQTLLVTIDFSEITALLLKQAEQIALKFHSKVYLLHIAEPEPDFIGYQTGPQTRRDHVAEHLREEHQKLQKLAEQLRSKEIDTTALLVQGATVEKILQEAKKLKITLILMGSHHYNPLKKLFHSSISQAVLEKAVCPVFVIPNQA